MKRKAIRSAQRPLARWMTTYPVVAARCCLSLDSSLATTSRADARATNITTTFAVTNIGTSYNTTPIDHEALRLGRVFRRLHQKKMKYDNSANNANSSSHLSVIEQTNGSLDQQLMRIKQEISDATSHRRIVHSFLPQGTGISFIDAVLGRESLLTPPTSKSALLECKKKEQAADQTTSRLALELNGPRRSGMTSILLAVAARYVACTSIAMLFDNGCHAKDTGRGPHRMHDDDYKSTTMKKCKVNGKPMPRSIEPRVVILDLEKGVHAVKLALSVREAVLRRWEETAPARQWNREQEKQWAMDGAEEERHNTTITSEADDDEDGEKFNTTMNEQRQIELAIASCLGRINIVQPRDCTHLSLLATLEELRHSLDEERDAAKRKSSTDGASSSTQHVEAPTLIMIDSLTALDASTRYLESLPTNAGSKGSARSGGSGLFPIGMNSTGN
ncbi:hypothetical protein ACHAWU_003415 [Discostella pseudostelligera]|uniref:Uncharacterized protein n=1 Tax=Discostella pseudostelligera TaxID=259834 RepID=A0ABD3MRZ6_9STRA